MTYIGYLWNRAVGEPSREPENGVAALINIESHLGRIAASLETIAAAAAAKPAAGFTTGVTINGPVVRD